MTHCSTISVTELDDLIIGAYLPAVDENDREYPNYLINSDEFMKNIILPDTSKFCKKHVTTCTLNGKIIVDKSLRVCESYSANFCIESEKLKQRMLELYGKNVIHIGQKSLVSVTDWIWQYITTFELLRYSEGGFFLKHNDRLKISNFGRSRTHTHIALIYPPSYISEYTGGDLILYDHDGAVTHTIVPSAFTNWTCVIFEQTTSHEITPVTSGKRFVFKGAIFSEESDEMLED